MIASSSSPEVREAVVATDTVLEQLEEQLRIVFVLRFLEEMTINEISEACKVSPATVKRRLAAAAGLVALAATLASVLLRSEEPAPMMRFELEGAPAEAGRWYEPEEAARLEFSDGTDIHVAAGGRIRVNAIDQGGVNVELERGRIVASVGHTGQTQWRFEVGPYDVLVTGTRFEASWSPEPQRFDIRLQEGSVRVRGPRMETEQLVVAGQRLSFPAQRPESTRPADRVAPEPVPDAPRRDDESEPLWSPRSDVAFLCGFKHLSWISATNLTCDRARGPRWRAGSARHR